MEFATAKSNSVCQSFSYRTFAVLHTWRYFGDYDIASLDDFDQKVKYELKDEHLLIKFNAGEVPLENIVNYVFHTLHTQDFVISDINIEDIVKEILAKEENHEKI